MCILQEETDSIVHYVEKYAEIKDCFLGLDKDVRERIQKIRNELEEGKGKIIERLWKEKEKKEREKENYT